MRNLAAESLSESGRSLTDEEGVPDAPMVGGKRFDAALFGQPAGDPVDIFVAGQRFGGRIGVRGFRVIDVSNPLDRRDELLAVRQAWEGVKTRRRRLGGDAGMMNRGIGGGGVLPIMDAGQARETGHLEDAGALAFGVVDQTAAGHGRRASAR